jgi:hypothetical protein
MFSEDRFFKVVAAVAVVVCLICGIGIMHTDSMQAQTGPSNYPVPHIAAFRPTGQASIAATTTSANVALPTTGASSPIATTVVVTNEDASATAFVLLGTSNAVTATVSTGMPIPPHGQVVLTIGANTFIAAIGSAAATVGITTGR